MVNVGTAVGYLDLDTSKFQKGFKSALADMKTFTDSTQSATTRIGALGSAMTSAGSTLTKSVTLPLVAVGTAAVATAAQFESAMSEVSAISGVTGTDLERLSEKAQYMGATTKFSASEAAEGLKYMALAGWDTESMLDGLSGIMLLAAASGEELGLVSDIVTDALTAFGLEAKDSAYFADILATASAKSNTNVAMLGESFKYVAPLAGTMGYKVEDVGVALGLMANNGIKSSQAGTTLRQLLLNLIKPTDDAAAAMEELGITLYDDEGAALDFYDVMWQLRNGFSDLDDETKAFNASLIGGARGLSAITAIVDASEEDFLSLATALRNADGAAARMADTMMDNLQGQLTIAGSTVEGLAIAFGNILLPYIKEVVQWLQNLLDWLTNLSDSEKEQIVRVAAVVAAIGPILLILGKVISGVVGIIDTVKLLQGAWITLNAAIGVSPFGILLLAIAGVVAATTTLVMWFGRATDEQKKLDDQIGRVAKTSETLMKSIDNSAASFKEYNDSTEASAVASQNLAERIYALAEAEELSEAERQKLIILTDMFNEQMGETILVYDEETGALNKTREALEDVIEARKQELLAAASMERSVELSRELFEAEQKLSEAARARIELEIAKEQGVYDGWLGTLRYNDALNDLNSTEANLMNTIQELNFQLDEQIESTVEVAEVLGSAADEIGEKYVAMNGEILASQEDLVKYNKELMEDIGNYVDAVTNMFNVISEEANGTVEEYLDTLDKNLEASERFVKNLDELVDRGLDEAIVETWRKQGLASAGEVALWAKATDDEILDLNEKMARNLEQGAEDARHVLKVGGEEIVEGFVEGIEAGMSDAEKAGQELGEVTADATKEALDIHSPSGVYEDFGENVTEGYVGGINNGMPDVAAAMQGFAEAVMEPFDTVPPEVKTATDSMVSEVISALNNLNQQTQQGSAKTVTSAVTEFKRLPGETKQQFDSTLSNAEAWSTSMGNTSNNTAKTFTSNITTEVSKLPGMFSERFNAILTTLNNMQPSFGNAGRNMMQALYNEMQGIANNITQWFNNWASDLERRIDDLVHSFNEAERNTRNSRSHASGLDYVPYDGYQATLHQGERVLTAQEVREGREGGNTGGGDTFIFNSPERMSPADQARAMKQAKLEQALNFR